MATPAAAFPALPALSDLAWAMWENEGGHLVAGPAVSLADPQAPGTDQYSEHQSVVTESQVRVGRVDDHCTVHDGRRVLVDRLWPPGLSTDNANLDEWCKNVAPSTVLRTWYSHDPARFAEFARRYRAELTDPLRADALRHLRELSEHQTLTLLTATRNAEISEAVVLAELLDESPTD